MGDLYDVDVLEWSEHQAALLRRHVDGERLNEAPDWTNIIEEIESVGREQLHAVEGLLLQALVHQLKAMGWPEAADAGSWAADADLFREQAARRFAPSMRRRVDLGGIYAAARRNVSARVIDGRPAPALPETCPWTLEWLLNQQELG